MRALVWQSHVGDEPESLGGGEGGQHQILLHDVPDVVLVLENRGSFFSVYLQNAPQLQVVRQLTAGNQVEHGGLTAARGAEDGCEGFGGEAAAALFEYVLFGIDFDGFAVDLLLDLDLGGDTDALIAQLNRFYLIEYQVFLFLSYGLFGLNHQFCHLNTMN